MSKNPNDKQRRHEDTNKEQQQHHRQGEPMGQKPDQTGAEKKKQTVQFDKGQKFTSDEDIKRRSA